ncbi:MAG: AmmeMemoRadiSam system protein B [Nannocystaceae bacterium]
MAAPERPKLRRLERFYLPGGDDEYVVLSDPLGIAPLEKLDRDFEVVLDALDGTKSVSQIRQSLAMVHGLSIERTDLEDFVAQLNRDGFLEGDAFAQLQATAVATFDDNERRATCVAGTLYPDDPNELRALLGELLPHPERRTSSTGRTCGVLTPHHDFTTAGAVLDQTLRDLPSPADVDLVVVFGTDHAPGMRAFAATDKDYETPLGLVRTDFELADALFDEVPWVVAESLRHRTAHSIEFACVLLRFLYGEQCPPMLPILCGRTLVGSESGYRARDELLSSLTRLTASRRVLWWGSAELSHVGAAYGATENDDAERLLELARTHDTRCIERIKSGDRPSLSRALERAPPQVRPSGAATIDTLTHAFDDSVRVDAASYESVSLQFPHLPGLSGWAGLAGVRFCARDPIATI